MNRWVIFALAIGAGCTEAAPEESAGAVGEPAAAQAARAQGAVGRTDGTGVEPAREVAESEVVYVDVRTPQEYAAGHVEGAINIPHTEIERRADELEPYRGRPIVLYCRSGRRSGIAYDILQEQGFENLENGGGLSDLQRQGVPVTR